MPVETFNYLDSLNSANPVSTDGQAQGDDHIRGIKAVLKATFPNIAGVCAVTHTQLNNLGTGNIAFADGTSVAPSITFANDATSGFYKISTGNIGIAGRLTGDGACGTGMIADYLTASAPSGWYQANGQAVPRTGPTAALFAQIGTTYGPGNGSTTFNLPNLTDYFRRTSGSYAPGTFGADAIKSFTAPVATSGGSHTHSGTAAVLDHTHPWAANVFYRINEAGGGGAAQNVINLTGDFLASTSGVPSGTAPAGAQNATVNLNASGSLSMSGTATYTGGTETRPMFIAVATYIKA